MSRLLILAVPFIAVAACSETGGSQGMIVEKIRESDRCYAVVDGARHAFDCAAWEQIRVGNYWTDSLGKPSAAEPPKPAPSPAPEPTPVEPTPPPKPEACPEGREHWKRDGDRWTKSCGVEGEKPKTHGAWGSWWRDKVYGK